MILLVDNYDSFTYNLAHALGSAGKEVAVVRNDRVTPATVASLSPEGIVLSPGPGRPENAGHIVDIILTCGSSTPILGICLGHQAIGVAYGAAVVRNWECIHGRSTPVVHEGGGLFSSVPSPFDAGRYHSLVVSRERLPSCLRVTAQTSDGTIMGLQHTTYPVYGLQFHPESILTPMGTTIIQNWLDTQ